MKDYILLTIAMLTLFTATSQTSQQIPVVYLNKSVSTHFVSRLNIDYTDLSTNNVVGDLPMANILRIKPINESNDLGYATIVGESFFLQFQLKYSDNLDMVHKHIDLDNPEDFRIATSAPVSNGSPISTYDNPNYSLNHTELMAYSKLMDVEKPSLNNVVSKEYKMKLKLNNIWVVEDYIYFDYTLKNNANIPYSIDEIRYKIIDTKLVKATSNQDRLIVPDFSANGIKQFDDEFRNIVAFKKFTFPNDKSFIIEIAEDQISGRKITLEMSYSDILLAKTFKHEIEIASK
jgi:conjugative transposon TraN protein